MSEIEALRREINALRKDVRWLVEQFKRLPPAQEDHAAEASRRNLEYDPDEREALFAKLADEQTIRTPEAQPTKPSAIRTHLRTIRATESTSSSTDPSAATTAAHPSV